MNDKFWYYRREASGGSLVFVVYDHMDKKIAEHSAEPIAFNAVNAHNVAVLTEFEKAKLRGYAPGAV